MTKKQLMQVLEKATDDAIIFVDNGEDSVELYAAKTAG